MATTQGPASFDREPPAPNTVLPNLSQTLISVYADLLLQTQELPPCSVIVSINYKQKLQQFWNSKTQTQQAITGILSLHLLALLKPVQ